MSLNQSRGDKSEAQVRKPGGGRSGNSAHHKSGFSGAGGKGGGAAPAPPSPSASSSASLSSSRSFRKSVNNGQGAQSKAGPIGLRSEPNAAVPPSRVVQNGAHVQNSPHGGTDAAVPTAAKQSDTSAAKSSRTVPTAQQPQPAPGASDTLSPATPSKGDSSRAFPLQFGSISPGFMNGMQIPPRTSSAPPNLDEQKRDQVRHEPFKVVPTVPIPAAPKQHQKRKDVAMVNQPISVEPHPPTYARDSNAQAAAASAVTATQKSSGLPMAATSVPMPFQQAQVPVQFTGPNAPIQTQGIPPSTHQMPMAIPMGNAQVQSQVFVPSLQSHPLQAQGMVHQGQGIGYAPQMAHQLAPQLGNLGMGMTPQFPSQQPGKFSGHRKSAVKITDPKTHEELRLDKRTDSYLDTGPTGSRFPTNMPPQSQSIPSYAPAHSINYYAPLQPGSYNPGSVFFQTPTSVSLTNTQMNPVSSAPRYNYQVAQSGQPGPYIKPSTNSSLPGSKSVPFVPGTAEPINIIEIAPVSSAPLPSVQVTVKPSVVTHPEKISNPVTVSAPRKKLESPKALKHPVEVTLSQRPRDSEEGLSSSGQQSKSDSQEPISVVSNADALRSGPLRRSDSIKDQQKKSTKKEVRLSQPQHQVDQNDLGGGLKSPSLKTKESCNIADDISKELEKKEVSLDVPISSKETTEVSQDQHVGHRVASETMSIGIEVGKGCPSEPSKSPGLGKNASESHLRDTSEIDSTCVVQEVATFVPSSVVEKQLELESPKLQLDAIEKIHASDDSFAKENEEDSVVESVSCSPATNLTVVDSAKSADKLPEFIDADSVSSRGFSSGDAQQSKTDEALMADAPGLEDDKQRQMQDALVKESLVTSLVLSEISGKVASKATESNSVGSIISGSIPGPKDRGPVEQTRPKISAAKKKMKKVLLMKADAAGTTFDLYNAYKGPEEKQPETVAATSDIVDSSAAVDSRSTSADDSLGKYFATSEDGIIKDEVENWEDAEITTPTLKNTEDGPSLVGAGIHLKEYSGTGRKKYSRDFLFTLKEQYTELPVGFEIPSDVVNALMSGKVSSARLVDHNSYPSPGRIIDRPSGGSRIDRRVVNIVDDDKWNRSLGSFNLGRDGGGAANLRPGQGGIHGVLRNHPRGQQSGQYTGGILAGPMQSVAPQGGLSRNNSDADRWQRGTGLQKGLIPSPQTPAQRMHMADNRYQINKTVDEEEAKQRKLKGILNKLTPQNFEKLFEQVKEVNIDSATTLKGVISQIFDKALMEPTFCEMYANFCSHLAGYLPDFNENDEKITFKRVLLNKCQEEFERGEREQAEANKIEEGEIQQSEEEREEKRIKAKRRMLGNIRLIGELYKKRMLTERIMHECIKKLLGQYQNPDEEDVEALCKLLSTIGEMIDHPIAKEHMDAYFDMMNKMSMNQKLSSRVRFMLKDSIDLRKNRWQQRRKVEGPKKIDEVHRDAAQERQLQASRSSRGPSMGSSARRGQQPLDYGSRGTTMLPSPGSQQIGGRSFAAPVRGYGMQDVRFEDRHPLESRKLSVPLPQRPTDDDSIMLGPQGGLGRGMSIRGQHPSISGAPPTDVSPGGGDQRRLRPGPNGYGHGPDWQKHKPQEEVVPRFTADRFMGHSGSDSLRDQSQTVLNRDPRNLDRSVDRSTGTMPSSVHVEGPTGAASVVPEPAFSGDKLRDLSIAAIREYYSVRNEEEVRLCIKDLKSPGFYPDMIMLWVVDSFDRKNDIDRELLAKLLTNLCKACDGPLSSDQLIRGFESVLSTLEDSITDSPKAAEYLGRIFGKVILENVIPFREIGRLIQEGGVEPGSLLQTGLASDVLVSVLEMIRGEKGDSGLKEIQASSNLMLEVFRPQDPIKSRRLEALIY